LSQSPPYWLWFDNIPSVAPYYLVNSGTQFQLTATTVSYDFWRYPFGIPANVTMGTPAYIDSLDSPGDVGNDTGYGTQQDTQRNASFAILNTQLAMQLLAADPANRAALEKLSADSKMLPTWESGNPLQATPYSPQPCPTVPCTPGLPGLVGLLKEDGTDSSALANSNYLAGMHVAYLNNGTTSFFVCSPGAITPQPTPQIIVNAKTPVPGGSASTTGWVDETASPHGAPILLDGWGNPIIFVPASGLHVKLINGQSSYLATDPSSGATQEYIIVSPEGHVTGQGTANPWCDRPGRPFFASAGPDGDFTKGDDNLYSFEN